MRLLNEISLFGAVCISDDNYANPRIRLNEFFRFFSVDVRVLRGSAIGVSEKKKKKINLTNILIAEPVIYLFLYVC